MVQEQLDLFDWRAEPDEDYFFAIEDAEERGEAFGYPLDVFVALFRTIYAYFVVFLIVFGVSAWLGLAIGDNAYVSPIDAMNSFVVVLYVMLAVPVFWPILVLQAGCFFFPIRRGTTDAMVLSLVALVMVNLVAFGFVADMTGPDLWF